MKTPSKRYRDALGKKKHTSAPPQSLEENEKKKVKIDYLNLTEKEIAIVNSLAKGNSYKMIANDCNITINTVRQHIRNIYRKLNVHTGMEAVVLVLKQKNGF